MKLLDTISYLNSPELVVKFQKLCGIEKIENVEKKKSTGTAPSSDEDKVEEDVIHSYYEKVANLGSIVKNKQTGRTFQNHHTNRQLEQNLKPKHQINNFFLYYLFMFGAKLGEEIFYISFFPFWFWNVDGFVGRRLCVFWAAFMYLGQASKDILKMPRPPSPPVVRLESKYDKEFGMPSTHSMVAAGLPFSIFFLTRDRYIFPSELTLLLALVWCSVVCCSRIYLGMHSVLDVIAGLLFVFLLMFLTFRLGLLDIVDWFILKGGYMSLCVCLLVPLFLCLCYPSSHLNWSSARSDTFTILAVCSGSLIAHWLNFNLGNMKRPIGELGFCGAASTVESIFYAPSSVHCNPQYLGHYNHLHYHTLKRHHRHSDGTVLSRLVALHPPYPVPALDFQWLLVAVSRTFLGLLILLFSRLLIKLFVKFTLNLLQQRHHANQPPPLLHELFSKFLVYSSITIIGLVCCPLLFHWLNIERETYFTEL